jgi:hypothetical protein
VRLIQKWLKAGVLEDGKRIESEVGTGQGGSSTPPTQSQTLSLNGWYPTREVGITLDEMT